jgi:hypothetical protein
MFLVQVRVKSGKFQAEHPHQLLLRETRVHHRAEHIEKGLDAQFLSDRCHVFIAG